MSNEKNAGCLKCKHITEYKIGSLVFRYRCKIKEHEEYHALAGHIPGDCQKRNMNGECPMFEENIK